MSDRCRIVVGRLIAHPCARRARVTCPKCHRPVCEEHLSGGEDGRCRECTGELQAPQAPIQVGFEELMDFSTSEVQAFDEDVDDSGVGLIGS